MRNKRACQKAGGVDFAARAEIRKLVQVDFVVLHAVERCKTLTTHKRQAAVERQVAALVIQADASASASALSFGTTTGSLALSGGNTAANSLAIFFRAIVRLEIVSVSYLTHTTSSTSTRWMNFRQHTTQCRRIYMLNRLQHAP